MYHRRTVTELGAITDLAGLKRRFVPRQATRMQ
jgi:hypothetical protein